MYVSEVVMIYSAAVKAILIHMDGLGVNTAICVVLRLRQVILLGLLF